MSWRSLHSWWVRR